MRAAATSLVETKAGRESPEEKGSRLAFEVAGVRVAMNCPAGGPALEVPAAHAGFEARDTQTGVEISVHWAEEIPEPREGVVFDSGGVWRLYRHGDGWEFCFRSPAWGAAPYKTARMDASFARGEVWLSRRVFGERESVYPLEYPLDELLVIHRLSRGEGVEVHGCGVVDERGRGLLFTGHSGAGKSTLARLWAAEERAQILSDDRIILRREDDGSGRGRILMHGTPWHGEGRFSLPMAAPLTAVYVLEHAKRGNEIERLEPMAATAELMSRCFLPFHDAGGLEFALQFLAGVTTERPCSAFRFVPDTSAVREIENRE